MKKYNVHILDISTRPATLPISPSLTYHKGSIDPSSPALSKLFAKVRIDGVIHLGAISLEEWCSTRFPECERINVGGTKALLDTIRGKGSKTKTRMPWMILASSVEVFDGERNNRNPTSAIGRTKLSAELAVEGASEIDPDLRSGIIRIDEIYGYDHSSSIPSTFIPSLIINALTGLPIQYSSTRRAKDYIHVDDAVTQFLGVIEMVKEADVGDGVVLHDLLSGNQVTEWQVVDIVRRQTNTLSPIRDLGASARPAVSEGSTIDLEIGLGNTISNLISANEAYNAQYLSNHCPTSISSLSTKIHPADERNKDLTKLDGCTVNIGFNHAGILHHLKCEDGKNCIADGVKVPSYNWNQSVFVIHKVPGKREERRVRIRLAEEKGMGWLGVHPGSGREVGLQLYGNHSIGVDTAFDLEVSIPS
jgi:nucleoside-diphosphate-sugar epimerase